MEVGTVKRIVSVSLGSSKRDHAFETDFLGERFSIERIGTNGNWDQALQLIRDLDGKVAAFGMGGIDLYISIAGRRYVIKDAKRLLAEARKTPMVDGSGIKNTLERKCIMDVQREMMDLRGKKVLMVCAVDRFGMAEAFDEVGAHLTLGDLVYSLGIPVPLHSLKALRMVGSLVAPIVVRMPFDKLYPTGDKQDVIIPKHEKYYYEADIIAGDFLYIRRHLPEKLNGQVIITNTTTRDDLDLLARRGISQVVTTTPDMGGRSFGTNVIEALMVSILAKPVDQITANDYYGLLREMDIKPGITDLRSRDG